jgi:hypothetical protein
MANRLSRRPRPTRKASHTGSRSERPNRKLATSNPKPDAQGLVELACECLRSDCDRLVKVPLDVYTRILEADHYLLQAGHHAFARYRTIVSVGLMRIEERA